jgi:hypothetical protein
MAAALVVTIGTTCSIVSPSASIELIAWVRLNFAWPANGWLRRRHVRGVPGGGGTWVL